jgi:ribosomal-protein-alanine N-acetyltransferase
MEISKIKFRNAGIGDIASIIEIEHTSFSRFICESEEVFKERINTFPEGFRVMEYSGEVIGYISSEIWNRADRYTKEYFTLGHSITERHNPEGNEIYVSSMGILPPYRSRGLGKLLFGKFIRYAENEFINVDSAVLIVSEKWLNARRIYKGTGFKEIQKIDKFFKYEYDKPYYEDGIVMRKKW